MSLDYPVTYVPGLCRALGSHGVSSHGMLVCETPTSFYFRPVPILHWACFCA